MLQQSQNIVKRDNIIANIYAHSSYLNIFPWSQIKLFFILVVSIVFFIPGVASFCPLLRLLYRAQGQIQDFF